MHKVAFRVDGSPNIGMGHIMRCISLAKEFRKQSYEIYFFSKFKLGICKIMEQDFKVIQLKFDQTNNRKGFHYEDRDKLAYEAEEIVRTIKNYNIDLLFIDSYNVTEEYFLQIKPYVKKLAYIDDINKFIYPVDILINGNITGSCAKYTKYSDDEILLLGTKYSLIREEFRNLPEKEVNKHVKEIMITTGGSDPYNMSSEILNIILSDEELSKLKINVVLGNGFNNKEKLRKTSMENENVILHENVKYISKIMLQSDIAISSGGSTLYELCTCGIPVLAFVMADNQEVVVRKMDELGYVKSLGWYNAINANMLLNVLKRLILDFNLRKKMKETGSRLVDTKGVERIVSCITSKNL